MTESGKWHPTRKRELWDWRYRFQHRTPGFENLELNILIIFCIALTVLEMATISSRGKPDDWRRPSYPSPLTFIIWTSALFLVSKSSFRSYSNYLNIIGFAMIASFPKFMSGETFTGDTRDLLWIGITIVIIVLGLISFYIGRFIEISDQFLDGSITVISTGFLLLFLLPTDKAGWRYGCSTVQFLILVVWLALLVQRNRRVRAWKVHRARDILRNSRDGVYYREIDPPPPHVSLFEFDNRDLMQGYFLVIVVSVVLLFPILLVAPTPFVVCNPSSILLFLFIGIILMVSYSNNDSYRHWLKMSRGHSRNWSSDWHFLRSSDLFSEGGRREIDRSLNRALERVFGPPGSARDRQRSGHRPGHDKRTVDGLETGEELSEEKDKWYNKEDW